MPWALTHRITVYLITVQGLLLYLKLSTGFDILVFLTVSILSEFHDKILVLLQQMVSLHKNILLMLVFLKAWVHYFLSIFYFSPNDSPSKTMKALFVLKIFKFLYFHLPLLFSLSAIALELDPGKILKFMTSSAV